MKIFLSLLLALAVTGCGSFPYKVEVPQGNVITAEQLRDLKPGMTKRQVRFLLGSPALNDAFHPQRWDYVESTGLAGGERTLKTITLVFDQDQLVQIQGETSNAGLALENQGAPKL